MKALSFLSPLFRFRRPVKTLAPHSAYELWARTYDQRDTNALLQAEEQAMLPILRSMAIAGKKVADVGCGTGRYLRHCSDAGASHLVGVDFSRQMLLATKNKGIDPACLLCESSIEALPLRTAWFDVVISTLVLAHLPSFQRAVHEMSRVLKPRGFLVLSDFHPENLKRNWKRTFAGGNDRHSGRRFAAESYHHPIEEYREEFRRQDLHVDRFLQPAIDPSLEPLFQKAKASHIYRQFFGTPILIIFLLRKLEPGHTQ